MREKLNTAKKNIKSAVKKFNIIDILLIALIFLSLISLLYKLTWGSSEKYQSYEFVYICDSAPSELADSVSAKSKCADGDTGENLGEVIRAVLAFFCKFEFSMIKYSVLWAGMATFWLSCLIVI